MKVGVHFLLKLSYILIILRKLEILFLWIYILSNRRLCNGSYDMILRRTRAIKPKGKLLDS